MNIADLRDPVVKTNSGDTQPSPPAASTPGENTPAVPAACPFQSPYLQIGRACLSHTDQLVVVRHFLKAHRLYLLQDLRTVMVRLASLGHVFAPEEWARTLNDYTPPSDKNTAPPSAAPVASSSDRWPLNINPEMDKHAAEQGLGHWSCVSPESNQWWVRKDRKQFEVFTTGVPTLGYPEELKAFDAQHPIHEN